MGGARRAEPPPGELRIGGEEEQGAEPWGEARRRRNHVSSFASCRNRRRSEYRGARLLNRFPALGPGEPEAGVEGGPRGWGGRRR